MLTLTLTLIVIFALWSSSQLGPGSGTGCLARFLDSSGPVFLIFSMTFAVLWFAWAALDPIPVVHDEMSYVLQAQIFARATWALPSPPLPEFWAQPHVLTEPALASKYFPGHALLLAAGAVVKWMPLMPLLLQAASACLLFLLARRVSSGAVGLLAWVVWLSSPMVLYFGASYFSESTTTFCWLAGWYALLRWREERSAVWLVAVAVAVGWDAITRPLTGVAYAIPVAIVVCHDTWSRSSWRQFAYAFAAGSATMLILPISSAFTTGDWRTTPLALYTRLYMPFDVPGFGLISTAPAHTLTPEMVQVNNVYSLVHVNHFPSTLLATFAERAMYLAVSIWGSSRGILMIFAVLGLITMSRDVRFALASAVLLLVTYLSFATPAQWTLYYYESVPVYAYLTAAGMAWCASLAGAPRTGLRSRADLWMSSRWSRALTTASIALIFPGIVSLIVIHGQHIGDRKFLARFDQMIGTIPEARAIVFVHYAATHNPHITFVRNVADRDRERVLVVYDRGSEENSRLLARIPGRTPYRFDEISSRLVRVVGSSNP